MQMQLHMLLSLAVSDFPILREILKKTELMNNVVDFTNECSTRRQVFQIIFKK